MPEKSFKQTNTYLGLVGAVGGTTAVVSCIITGIAFWNYQTKIVIEPLQEVVRMADRPADARPVSQITKADKRGTWAWAGYEAPLLDVCQTGKKFFEDEKEPVKLLIPNQPGEEKLALVRTSGPAICDFVQKEPTKYRGVYVIYGSVQPDNEGKAKVVYFRTRSEKADDGSVPILMNRPESSKVMPMPYVKSPDQSIERAN
jgi:hypothetical protein